MKRLICLTALILVAGLAAFAQPAARTGAQNTFASDFLTIPVMGNVPGFGGTFQTYVALLNPTSSTFTVTATLHEPTGAKRDAMITLAGGELKTYANFLQSVFNYTGGGAVTFRSADSAKRFIVNTEVRTGGTHYSTSIPALEFAGSSSRSFVAGITVDAASRTNIGCFNQSADANAVAITILDSNGLTVGTTAMNLAGNAWGQMPIQSVVSNGYVRFDPAEAAVCYAVVVDNATNDGRFIPATEYEP